MMASASASILMSFLVVLVLMGSANSKPVCGENCIHAGKLHVPNLQFFQHVSELKDSSISPWTLKERPGSELSPIEEANCTNCSDDTLVAKPIYIRVYVFERVRSDTSFSWCACLREVAVGCTCIRVKEKETKSCAGK